jgi:hypothetical protein
MVYSIYHNHVLFFSNCPPSFALVTMTAAVEFLRDDPLSLGEACSISSTSSCTALHFKSPPTGSSNSSEAPSQPTALAQIRHRKSVSADLCLIARHSSNEHSGSPWSRRETPSPNLVVRPRIVIPKTPPADPASSYRSQSSDWSDHSGEPRQIHVSPFPCIHQQSEHTVF